METRGITVFLNAKNVDYNKAMQLFKGHKNMGYKKTVEYINQNFNEFANFIDKAIRSGALNGKPVKLSYHFDEQRQIKEEIKKEISELTEEEITLVELIRKHDDFTRLSRTASFFNKRGINLPANDNTKQSRTGKNLPKIHAIMNSGLKEEFITYLTNQ